jgi:hypothetical protein
LDNSAAQDTTKDTQAAAQATQSQAVDWVGALPEDLRGVVSIKGWKTPADTIKSYSELEKLVGHEKIALPKKNDKGEYNPGEFERVMGQLGLPKDPKEYKTSVNFKLPDGVALDDKFMGEFKAEAHKAGLLPSQYAFVMDKLANVLQQGTTLQKEASEKSFNDAALNLRTKWGVAYEQKTAIANKILQTFVDKGVSADVVKRFGNDPAIIELLANVGSNLSEESMSKVGMSGSLLTPEAATQEIAKLRAEHAKELTNESDPQHAYYVTKLNELYKQQAG